MRLVLALGSNCGDREKQLYEAIEWLRGASVVTAVSSIYETPDLAGRDAPYLNAVVEVEVNCAELDFNSKLKRYEIQSGRTEECRRNHLVPVDIDIVLIDDRVVRERDFKAAYFKKGYNELR